MKINRLAKVIVLATVIYVLFQIVIIVYLNLFHATEQHEHQNLNVIKHESKDDYIKTEIYNYIKYEVNNKINIYTNNNDDTEGGGVNKKRL